MNVLFINNNVFDRKVGGLERSTINIIESISDKNGIKCFTMYNNYNDSIAGVTHLIGVFDEYCKIDEILNEYKIDTIFFPCGPWYPVILKKISKKNVNVITQYHSAPGYEKKFYLQNLVSGLKSKRTLSKIKALRDIMLHVLKPAKYGRDTDALFNMGVAASTSFVLLSNEYINPFISEYRIEKEYQARITCISNSLPFEEGITQEQICEKENRILIVSRLDDKNKRISHLLDIWKKSRLFEYGWSLDVVGDGKDARILEAYASKQKLQNLFFYGKKNPLEFYKKAKIFLMASNWEGMPMTILEAKQMGCVPIVYNSFASINELVQDGIDGFIIQDNDDVDFVDKLISLTQNNETLVKMCLAGFDNAKLFSKEYISKKWLNLFNTLNNDYKIS